jgi:hypothetical protein
MLTVGGGFAVEGRGVKAARRLAGSRLAPTCGNVRVFRVGQAMRGRVRMLGSMVVAGGLCVAAPASSGEYEDNMLRLTEHQPRAVVAVIHRLVECNRWAAGGPYDLRAFRRAPPAVRALRCDTVLREEATLRRRYARNADVLSALKEAHGYLP